MDAIKSDVERVAIKTVRDFINKNVYSAYAPNDYSRTHELLNSVTLGNIKIGTKYATFDIFMDTSKINPYEQDSWNAHANASYTQDTSEYIPMWIEQGTSGSLWDRDGDYYMEDSLREFEGRNALASALAKGLRRQGWDVKVI